MNNLIPESQSDDCNVICPYCLSKYQPDSCDFDDREREEERGKCGKIYLLSDDFSVTHNTRPK